MCVSVSTHFTKLFLAGLIVDENESLKRYKFGVSLATEDCEIEH